MDCVLPFEKPVGSQVLKKIFMGIQSLHNRIDCEIHLMWLVGICLMLWHFLGRVGVLFLYFICFAYESVEKEVQFCCSIAKY